MLFLALSRTIQHLEQCPALSAAVTAGPLLLVLSITSSFYNEPRKRSQHSNIAWRLHRSGQPKCAPLESLPVFIIRCNILRKLHRKLQDDNHKSKQPTNWVHRLVHYFCHKMVTANTEDPRNSLGALRSCWDFRKLYEIVKSKFFSGLNNLIRKKYVALIWYAALGTLTNLAAS